MHTLNTGSTKDAIRTVYGVELARELISFVDSSDRIDDTESKDILDIQERYTPNMECNSASSESLQFRIFGFISNANYSSKKSISIIFINNRLVECVSIRRVVEAVYADILPKHTHPFIYMSLLMPHRHVGMYKFMMSYYSLM